MTVLRIINRKIVFKNRVNTRNKCGISAHACILSNVFCNLETSSTESPPAKKKPSDKESSSEEVFEDSTTESPSKKTNDLQPEPSVEDTNGPDLTCSEQLPTNCASPDPYTGEFPDERRFFENGVKNTEAGNGSKEKDSSSSLDEGKVSYNKVLLEILGKR